MSKYDLVLSHVERLMGTLFSRHELLWGEAGRFCYDYGNPACFVYVPPPDPRTLECDPHVAVVVQAAAVSGLRASAALLREVNDLSVRNRAVNVCLEDGDLLVRRYMLGESVDLQAMRFACGVVRSLAYDIAGVAVPVFGGRSLGVGERWANERNYEEEAEI